MGFCHVPGTGLGSGGASAAQSDIAETLGQQIIPSWSRRVSRGTEDVGQVHCGAGALCCLFVKRCVHFPSSRALPGQKSNLVDGWQGSAHGGDGSRAFYSFSL